MLRTNMRVRITGELGTCYGRIEELKRVEDLPDLPGAGVPLAGEFAPKSILCEWGVSRVALISYHVSPEKQLLFSALEIGDDWYDLQRQQIALEIVGFYSA